MTHLRLADLVANGTLSADGQHLLQTIARQHRSFVVYALPRNAGKSTLMEAVLGEAPTELPITQFFGASAEVVTLRSAPKRGYVTIAEISPGFRVNPGYLSDDDATRAFSLIGEGFALATSLHADDISEAFIVLVDDANIPIELVGMLDVAIGVRLLGDPSDPRTRRVVEAIYEIDGASSDGFDARLLYRWDRAADRFELVEPARKLVIDP